MDLLINFLNLHNIPYTNEMMAKFERYYTLLIEWNEKFNLTAITEKTEVYVKHFIDSIYAYKFIKSGDSVVDIGSGAGFPAIPLAILFEDISFTLVDSLNKRVVFLNFIIENLALPNCKAFHSRAEDFATANKNTFTVALARGVASLNTLLEYLIPLLKVNGKAICFKSTAINEELENASSALKILNCPLSNRCDYTLFSTDIFRVLVEFIKTKPTSPIYPRPGNKPKLFPL